MEITGKITGIKYKTLLLHNQAGFEHVQNKIGKEVDAFMQFLSKKAQKVQSREMGTIQPKESLSANTKAKITITNYLGGQYFFTVAEVMIDKDTVSLIESKHSKQSILPSKGDIKDGLLKMILYSNLCEVEVDGKKMKSKAVLKLTSPKIDREITSEMPIWDRGDLLLINDFSQQQIRFIDVLMDEAVENGFEVRIENIK
jgi:hypothetical protein